MTRLLLAILAFYKRWLSPAVHSLGGGGCKYLPTCSEYAAIAVATHGPLRGGALAAWRLLRCHPFAHGGFDPVPAARGNNDRRKDRFLGNSLPPAAAAPGAEERCGARPFPHEPLP